MALRHNWIQNTQRLLKKRLVIPIIRSPHSPEHTARGVAIGTLWAMTPLVGIQMWLVSMTWVFYKKVLKKTFSLPLGLAFTWITNVFTMVPVYYIFYLTGTLIMGKKYLGYAALKDEISQMFLGDMSFTEECLKIFELIVKDWGLAMLIGCIPWMFIGYWLGYKLTLQFLHDYHLLREKRRLIKLQKRLEELHK